MVVKLKCACFGNFTIDCSFDVCPVCFWEQDDVAEQSWVVGGPNGHLSIGLARENYKKYGACDEGSTVFVRLPLPDEIPTRDKAQCACCGNYTITYFYERCPICNWVQSSEGEYNPDEIYPANSIALSVAQQNYKEFGVLEKKS